MPQGTIIGAVALIISGLIVLAIVIYCYCRQRQNQAAAVAAAAAATAITEVSKDPLRNDSPRRARMSKFVNRGPRASMMGASQTKEDQQYSSLPIQSDGSTLEVKEL
eukprot:TRINITY_DN9078_c0_g1_i6.p1 TRINITY_DN9078_c0_g1~~TRINITY_DN9078_c0_g1_i6.p1  ORF type:complete len:107 (+),score=8.92 TRINITY_DN9078_c0_g1_i6:364-684(+)